MVKTEVLKDQPVLTQIGHSLTTLAPAFVHRIVDLPPSDSNNTVIGRGSYFMRRNRQSCAQSLRISAPQIGVLSETRQTCRYWLILLIANSHSAATQGVECLTRPDKPYIG